MKKRIKRRPLRAPRQAKKMPPELPGFVTVSAARFAAVVNAQGAAPFMAGQFDPATGYRTDWRLPNGQTIAATLGGTVISHTRHMLAVGQLEGGDSFQGEQE